MIRPVKILQGVVAFFYLADLKIKKGGDGLGNSRFT